MRNGFWGNGVGRFVLSCTAISAIGLGIGAFGPGVLAWMSKPAQAQDVVVLPKDTKPSAASSVPYMSLVPSAQATRPVQQEMPAPAQLRSVPGLVEPLIADGMPTPEQEAALAAATAQFAQLGSTAKDFAEQAVPLLTYLSKYPSSPWSMALQADLGFGYYNAGYYSRAIDAWQQAWQLGRNSEIIEVKRLADRAIGELIRMHARVGHADAIDKLLGDLGDRPLTGAATEFVSGAREGAWVMRNRPEIAYLCGPKALVNVLQTLKASDAQIKVANDAVSGPHGYNLTQLSALASKAGVAHQVVHRAAGQAVPVPSIINWKLNHYAAIVAEQDGRYIVKDPTFADGDRVVTREAIDAEGSGYFIVPAGATKSSPAAPQAVQDSAAKASASSSADWRTVDPASDEAKSVYGMGYATGPNAWNSFGCAKANPGMCGSSANPYVVSVTISDTPVGYAASKGFKTAVTLTYNQREATQPASFTYFNVGQKWNLNWLSFIVDHPTTVGQASRYLGGGGAIMEVGYSGSQYTPELASGAILKRTPASGTLTYYTLQFPDGSRQVFGQPDGATTFPRRVFLTQVIDPAGNAINLAYDGSMRLSTITDAAGKVTTFSYDLVSYPLLVTKVTDPFGRYTSLTYDASQRLASITDPAGITSSFHYDAGGLIDQLKTPYGQTSYAYGDTLPGGDGYSRWLQITDPLSYTARMEYSNTASDISDTDPAAVFPSGMTGGGAALYNCCLRYRDTFTWDAHAFAVAGGTDHTKAVAYHWAHDANASGQASVAPITIKQPLENRVWFTYLGQYDSNWSGINDQPRQIGRVLDDGSTKLEQAEYDGTYGVIPVKLSQTDALGRQTKFIYDTNRVDLLFVQQKISSTPTYATLAAFTYDGNHNVMSHTDAAGQLWQYAYNAAGQMTYATNPLGQTKFWEYDSSGRITRITTPVAVAYGDVAYGTTNVSAPTAQSFNYTTPCSGVTAPANTNLPISVTDSEGYTLCYQYDALDRVTVVKYPDNTTDLYDYRFPSTANGWPSNWPVLKPDGVTSYAGTPSLDVWRVTDRLGRIVNYSYDLNRRLISKSEMVKVAGVDVVRTTGYSYYENGVLKELTDANGAVTHWEIDLQSRPTSKTYAYRTPDAKTETYTYENTTSRLKSITDAKGQTVTYTYNKDNSIASYAYTGAVVATAGASFFYDSWYPRRTSMTDQYGTTTWTYRAVLTNGALGLDTEDGPFSNDTITYTYDAAGRVATRKIDAANESLTYDLLGRLQSHYIQDLATFAYTWLGNSGQLASRQAIGSVSFTTSYGYDTNANDRRLLTITNTGSAARNYSYTTNPYQITGLTETMPAGHPWTNQTRSYSYDASDRLLTATASTAGNKSYSYDKLDNATSFAGITGTYNSLNQINTFNGTSYTYDANGNLTSDGARTYTYDAADRLVRINYTGSTAKSEFGYDGLGRRVVLVETPATGSAVTSRYLWCGVTICQERDGSNTVTRRYYAGEGERRPTLSESYAYMTDHLGSVREMVGLGTGIMKFAFDYDAYGNSERTWTNTSTPWTNQRYAGLFYHPASGLYLSATRAYNPANGKWLNVDPIREAGGINLTGYVGASPSRLVDPSGNFGLPGFFFGMAGGAVAGGIAVAANGGSGVQILFGAVMGAGVGGLVGIVAPWAAEKAGGLAGVLLFAGFGGLSGGLNTMFTNCITGKNLSDGILTGVAVGAVVPVAISFEAIALVGAGGAPKLLAEEGRILLGLLTTGWGAVLEPAAGAIAGMVVPSTPRPTKPVSSVPLTPPTFGRPTRGIDFGLPGVQRPVWS